MQRVLFAQAIVAAPTAGSKLTGQKKQGKLGHGIQFNCSMHIPAPSRLLAVSQVACMSAVLLWCYALELIASITFEVTALPSIDADARC